MADENAEPRGEYRVRVFVDFWNFQLNLDAGGSKRRLDWKKLGPWCAKEAGLVCVEAGQAHATRFEEMYVYISYDPQKAQDSGLKRWAVNTLDRFAGVNVTIKERRPKDPPKCPVCHEAVSLCPACNKSMKGTQEKGIDTALVTDMIRLAWEDTYDIAVLVSGDRDFIPAVEFLNQRGRKVIHGGFPPKSSELSRKCWGSFNVLDRIAEIVRPDV